jgi:O-methyltransferase involved in polyketide biosynthesis
VANRLDQSFEQAFKVFDPNRPLVVISEGLINYFDKNLLKQLIQSIGHYGAT